MKRLIITLAIISSLFIFSKNTLAEEQQKAENKILNRITVTGGEEGTVAGAADFISPEELEETKQGYDDIHRILRQVPGVNIQEEDGFGLRPNIGFRGTSVERSANITLMEDSVLIAPAPYSAPSAYFFPTTGRMESIEVLKGSSQIKYGPRTTGGSLNLFSTSIPDEFRAKAKIQGGEHNSKLAHVNLGESYDNVGWLLETYQATSDGFKELDGGGDTGFDIRDYVGKIRLNTDPNEEMYQELEFKFNVYDQESDETYLGLTREDFDVNPYRRYFGSQMDNIDVNHEQYMLRHYIELANSIDLTTTLYRNNTDRNWFKLETVNGNSVSSILRSPGEFVDELAWIKGADSPADSFALRNNNRDYYSTGVQTVLGTDFEIGSTEHQLEFGVRYHEDEEDRFQHENLYQMINRTLVLTSTGAPGSNANRISEATAWAFHIQDEIKWEDLTVTPGLRFESIELTRSDYGKEDPGRTGSALSRTSNDINVFIPGIGVSHAVSEQVNLFAGIHKGFSPPTPSSSTDIEEEESVNYEAGLDFRGDDFASKVVFFYNDYENLLSADTVSSGGTGTGDLFNAGEASVFGLEAVFDYNFATLVDSSISIPFRAAYTFTNAEFDGSFDSEFFGLVSDGDDLPYIPENQLYASLGAVGEKWSLFLNGHFVDSMATVPGQAGTVSTEDTDSYFVFDLNGEVKVHEGISLFASVQNLFDKEYAVARRPAGARPSLPQTFLAGVKFDVS